MSLRWSRKVAQSQLQSAEPSITRTSSNSSYRRRNSQSERRRTPLCPGRTIIRVSEPTSPEAVAAWVEAAQRARDPFERVRLASDEHRGHHGPRSEEHTSELQSH